MTVRESLLSVVPAWGSEGSFLIAALGPASSAMLNAAVQPGADRAPLDGPEGGTGLWVWVGVVRPGRLDEGEKLMTWDGVWRRASAADLVEFGMPLSENA